MIKGIYDAASGMMPRVLKQEIFANNMANTNSPGFKKDEVFLQVLSDAAKEMTPKEFDWEIPMLDDIYVDFEQGSIEMTQNDLDLAIEGDGFFVINTPSGTRYTRCGAFTTSAVGQLVDGHGNNVLSEAGPIFLPQGQPAFGSDGTISVDGNIIGKIKVVDFDKPYKLDKSEFGYYKTSDSSTAEKPSANFSLRQGYLERSNVNIIEEMINMMTSYRLYEASQKSIQAQDETLDKAVNDLGRTT
jgi:flagellar basal-body rod protein FlgF